MLTPRPIRVAVLCSGRAPGLEDLLISPERGSTFELVTIVSAGKAFADSGRIAGEGIRSVFRPRPPKDLTARERYDAETAEILHGVDLVILCCYLHILTAPMLNAFPGRIVNIHDSDLSILDESGSRRFVGLRSTRDAIMAGECCTRATAHIVTEELDAGPVLFRSDRYRISELASDARARGDDDILKAYAFAHREWVIRSAWGPLMLDAIRLFAAEARAAAERQTAAERPAPSSPETMTTFKPVRPEVVP